MDHFRFRSSVKIISFIDMTFSLVIILLTIMASIGVFAFAVHDQHFQDIRTILSSNRKYSRTELGRIFAIIWIMSFTFNILQFFAACALLSGTDLVEEEDSKSVHKCRFWQCTSIFLFMFIVLLVALNPSLVLIAFCVGEFIFRSVGIFFVNKFVGELEEENNLNSSSAQLYYYDCEIDPNDLEHNVDEL